MSDKMTLFVFATIGLIFASSVNTELVRNIVIKPGSKCQVYDVVIDPCPEAIQNGICELPQGINASINFKYVSGFSTKKPKTRLYAVTPLLDLPFLGMDTNACLYTNCPMTANVESSWSYLLYISESYPKNRYTVKFKYWNDEPHASHADVCTFNFDLKIV